MLESFIQKFNIADVITLFVALVAVFLGILNTWRTFSRDKVKLRVTPKSAYPVGGLARADNRTRPCIEVTNLSAFAVTISEVGFLLKGTSGRLAILQPVIIDGGKFPRRLNSRESFTVYSSPDVMRDNRFYKIRCAFAKTDCGVCVEGKSGALTQLINGK